MVATILITLRSWGRTSRLTPILSSNRSKMIQDAVKAGEMFLNEGTTVKQALTAGFKPALGAVRVVKAGQGDFQVF